MGAHHAPPIRLPGVVVRKSHRCPACSLEELVRCRCAFHQAGCGCGQVWYQQRPGALPHRCRAGYQFRCLLCGVWSALDFFPHRLKRCDRCYAPRHPGGGRRIVAWKDDIDPGFDDAVRLTEGGAS